MIFTLVFLFIGVWGQKARFDNYQLLRLFPEKVAQVKALRSLELAGEYDFWTRVGRINGSVDVLVPPFKKAEFKQFVDQHDIPYVCQMEDVQSVIDEEEFQRSSRCINMDWNEYHRLEVIYDWMDDIAKKYPFVKKVNVGKSYEGRRIKAIEISFKQNTTGVFIESGMHGREWITPAATSWMIDQILQSPEDSVFRNFTYFYIPVFNPDGYAYSWTHNRLWKKTRTPYKNGSVICYGADPNRNWDFGWKEESKNPCSENYAGPFAFSEVEMKSIANYLKCIANPRNVDIYIAYRSYSQILHYPWDHEALPAPHQELWQTIGEAAVDDLREVHGTEFDVGSFSEFFEPSGGISREWYYGMYNATISFTYELRDTGSYGFLLPPDQIVPTGEEILPSLERILNEYLQLNFTNSDHSLEANTQLLKENLNVQGGLKMDFRDETEEAQKPKGLVVYSTITFSRSSFVEVWTL